MDIVQRLSNFWNEFISKPSSICSVVLSIVAISILYFYIMRFLNKNNSGHMIFLFTLIMITAGAIVLLNDNISGILFLIIPVIMILMVLVLYSIEIKRSIWAWKKSVMSDVNNSSLMDADKIHTCIAEIIKALQNMSKNDVGAIIVLANDNMPSQIIDSGVTLNAEISSAVIESIFFPKTPLHDGAMIINGTTIIAAGCFLPLSQKTDNIPKDLGTRHRAGIGITENVDVMSIIVSEETGIISIAKGGKISRYADLETLKNVLGRYYWQELDSEKR